MTVSIEITRLKTSIANAYDALEAKGATIPAIENPDNLINAIESIPEGSGETVSAFNATGETILSGEKVFINDQKEIYNHCMLVGSPNIDYDTGIVNGFSNSNYIYPCFGSLQRMAQISNNWEFVTAFLMTERKEISQYIVGGNAGTYTLDIGIYPSGTLFLDLSSNGSSYNIGEVDGSTILNINTKYYIKLAFNGSKYTLSYSTDGVNYVDEITITSSLVVEDTTDLSYIGARGNIGFPLSGSIYLKDTYFSVNQTVVWTGCSNNIKKLYKFVPQKFLAKTFTGGNLFIDDEGSICNFWSSSVLYAINTTPNSMRSNPWEIQTKFKLYGFVHTNIIGGAGGTWNPYVCVSNFHLELNLASSSGSYGIANGVQGTHMIELGKFYYIKLGWDGSKYYVKLSSDGVNYVEDIIITSSTQIYGNGDIEFGYSYNDYFQGEIDTKFTTIIGKNPLLGYSSAITEQDFQNTISGIAIESIAPNSNGSVKTILPED